MNKIKKFLNFLFVEIKYWISIQTEMKYKIWFFISILRKIIIILFWKANYCYSYFPFKWDYIIKNNYGKFLINEPWDMSPIISTYFEEDLVSEFINTDKWIFLDIWSNIWKYSVILWKEWFKCYSIEPNPNLHKFILKNIELNSIQKEVNLIPFWIDFKEDSLKLKIPGWDNYWSWSIVNNYIDYKEVNINLITFSKLIQDYCININDIRLIKIDVEWYEKNVIDSMLNYLWKFNNLKIIIEMFDEKWNVDYIKNTLINNNFILIEKLYWDNYIFYKN